MSIEKSGSDKSRGELGIQSGGIMGIASKPEGMPDAVWEALPRSVIRAAFVVNTSGLPGPIWESVVKVTPDVSAAEVADLLYESTKVRTPWKEWIDNQSSKLSEEERPMVDICRQRLTSVGTSWQKMVTLDSSETDDLWFGELVSGEAKSLVTFEAAKMILLSTAALEYIKKSNRSKPVTAEVISLIRGTRQKLLTLVSGYEDEMVVNNLRLIMDDPDRAMEYKRNIWNLLGIPFVASEDLLLKQELDAR